MIVDDVGRNADADTNAEAAAVELPLLSVVVPAYNEALMLLANMARLYEYLRGLDRFRFELIIVNDASRPRSRVLSPRASSRSLPKPPFATPVTARAT